MKGIIKLLLNSKVGNAILTDLLDNFKAAIIEALVKQNQHLDDQTLKGTADLIRGVDVEDFIKNK
jgi:hypothetical protein